MRHSASMIWKLNFAAIDSGNGFSFVMRQAIIYTNAELWTVEPMGTNLSEIQIKILRFFKETYLKCRVYNVRNIVHSSICYHITHSIIDFHVDESGVYDLTT